MATNVIQTEVSSDPFDPSLDRHVESALLLIPDVAGDRPGRCVPELALVRTLLAEFGRDTTGIAQQFTVTADGTSDGSGDLTLTISPPIITTDGTIPAAVGWRSPALLLMLMAAAMQLAFASWSALQYNFAYEMLSFSGREIGIQQSIREIPGFLSFAAVFFLFAMREQTFAMVSLVLLGLGTAATGYFPSAMGFYITTFIGSMGFHYYETMHQSLTLQWLPKRTAAATMGKILGVAGAAQLAAYALIFLAGSFFDLTYMTMFALAGGSTMLFVAFMVIAFKTFPEGTPQTKALIVRRRYWLYYALTFVAGARRQVFLVFASWMMIERFGYAFKDIAALFFVNAAVLMTVAPFIGKLVERVGDRNALLLEYAGLAVVFTTYAFVTSPELAIALHHGPRAFRDGDCQENLFPEGCRSGGHRRKHRCGVHDKSHRGGVHSGTVRLAVAGKPSRCLSLRRCDGCGVTGSRFYRSTQP